MQHLHHGLGGYLFVLHELVAKHGEHLPVDRFRFDVSPKAVVEDDVAGRVAHHHRFHRLVRLVADQPRK